MDPGLMMAISDRQSPIGNENFVKNFVKIAANSDLLAAKALK